MIRIYDEPKIGMADPLRARIENRAAHQGSDWCALGAIIGLSGGIIAALAGALLTAITWFTATGGGNSYVGTVGTILLCMTIPLLVCGAHCLDLEETASKRNSKGMEIQ